MNQSQDQIGMELTEKPVSNTMDLHTAKVIADRIEILGNKVIIYTKTDVGNLCDQLTSRNIAWTVCSDFHTDTHHYQIYPVTLWWNHKDPSDQYRLPRYNTNVIANKSFGHDIAIDMVCVSDHTVIKSQDFNNSSLLSNHDTLRQEFKSIWPDLYNKYGNQIGYVAGFPVEPHSFIHINTYNIRQQIKTMVEQGAKRIVVSQLHEGALMEFYIKAQLIAWACRDFIDPKHFIITTATIGADKAWKKLCQENDIQDPVSIMECNLTESFCSPDPDELEFFDNRKYQIDQTHEKIFTSLNAGLLRHHRFVLGVELHDKQIFHKGIVSFSDYTEWSEYIEYGSQEPRQKFVESVPVWTDIKNESITGIDQNVHSSQCDLYDSYFSIVAETQYYAEKQEWFNELYMLKDTVFRTEKTIKPMWFKHPFITVGPRGYMKALRDQGYKTFHPYINEDYDSEPDDIKRLQMIVSEAQRLCNYTTEQWLDWKSHIAPLVEHNYKWIQENDIPLSYNDYEYLFKDIA